MEYAQFSDNGAFVMVSFDRKTDFAKLLSSEWSCDLLLLFTAANSSKCTWLNSTSIRISFTQTEYQRLVEPGDSLSLLGGKLRAECSQLTGDCSKNYVASLQKTAILSPRNPLRPVINLIAPPLISQCDDLVVDATTSTGRGNRPWKRITWSVKGSGTNATSYAMAMEKFLNSLRDITIKNVIPKKMLSPASYVIRLEVENFLRISSFREVLITVNDEATIPYTKILGSTFLQIKRGSTLTIDGFGELSKCADPAMTLSYEWEVSKNGEKVNNIRSVSVEPRRMRLTPFSLSVEAVYTMKLIAYSVKDGRRISSSSADVRVYVQKGVVLASVAGA
jgi:hypothetical protein